MSVYGAIEAGGTKFVCAVGSSPENLRNEFRFPTTTPEETITKAIDFFKEQNLLEPLAAIGIGSFGPLDLNRKSSKYGYITTTPKPNWSDSNILGIIKKEFHIPVGFDTDVNAAALGEYKWGAAKGLKNFIYLTIGTGIGGGAMINGNLLHGLQHPEMGHIFIPHDLTKDPYSGKCPYHKDCFEGLASGPAVNERWEQKAESLGRNHPAWDLEAEYISSALSNFICCYSPEKIILGGGVMQSEFLLPLIQQKVVENLNGYIQLKHIVDDIENYIVPPGLGNKSGILGAIALAENAYDD